MDILRNGLKYLILLSVGGLIYVAVELIWRGYSHWSMGIVGGLGFIFIGLINELFTYNMPLWKQCGIAMLTITVLEFMSGCVLNIWLGWNVWNYTTLDILGQVSIPAMIGWFLLSALFLCLLHSSKALSNTSSTILKRP